MRAGSLRAALAALAAASVLVLAAPGPAPAAAPAQADRALDRALRALVAMEGGPPGVISVVQRGERREVHTAGVAELGTRRPLRAGAHMRIASVAKAFSGAVALSLVDQGVLSLEDTIGARLPYLPAAWHPVTLGQLLAHTSGLADFTASQAFREAVSASPADPPPPRDLLGYVADQPLAFPPGSAYQYSNSDNVAVGLMVEAATGTPYADALAAKVLDPVGLVQTLLPQGTLLPDPFIRGYGRDDSGALGDVSQLVAFGGWGWASGGIVSTPANLNRFVRAYVGGALFGADVQRQQRQFVQGTSQPPGPGQNSPALALFRYRTRCGTVFGHTGSILGYTQLIAANANGRRSLTFTITEQYSDQILPALRRAQVKAVCAALARGRGR